MQEQQKQYDYIIAGSGCSGLSLLYRLLQTRGLGEKRILVVDKSEKQENDRTWCFWEKESGPFESIVHHRWDTLSFLTSEYSRTFELSPYSYKMIQAIDFYRYVKDAAASLNNVDFLFGNILGMSTEQGKAVLTTDNGRLTADYIFHSTGLFNPVMNESNSLLQHFEGWVIRTETDTFDSKVGTLMDFRIPQVDGATFMYVLPTSSKEALVEYTLFSPALLDRTTYGAALKDYLEQYLQLSAYEVVHKEFGIIPMSLASFSRATGKGDKIVQLGTAGGFTKASSGYTFQFIQKHTAAIVDRLLQGQSPLLPPNFSDKKYAWYDKTLLDVLLSGKMTGKKVFSSIFRKLPPATIFRFLGNESSLVDDLRIMSSLPLLPFLTSGIRQLRK
jgi:lycopene beta-cyclase